MEVNIAKLQNRAGQGANHMRRFVPSIGIILEALNIALGTQKVEHFHENQCRIAGHWIGKFVHGNIGNDGKYDRTTSHLAIYEPSASNSYQPGKLVLKIRNEAGAKLFADTVKFIASAIRR